MSGSEEVNPALAGPRMVWPKACALRSSGRWISAGLDAYFVIHETTFAKAPDFRVL